MRGYYTVQHHDSSFRSLATAPGSSDGACLCSIALATKQEQYRPDEAAEVPRHEGRVDLRLGYATGCGAHVLPPTILPWIAPPAARFETKPPTTSATSIGHQQDVLLHLQLLLLHHRYATSTSSPPSWKLIAIRSSSSSSTALSASCIDTCFCIHFHVHCHPAGTSTTKPNHCDSRYTNLGHHLGLRLSFARSIVPCGSGRVVGGTRGSTGFVARSVHPNCTPSPNAVGAARAVAPIDRDQSSYVLTPSSLQQPSPALHMGPGYGEAHPPPTGTERNEAEQAPLEALRRETERYLASAQSADQIWSRQLEPELQEAYRQFTPGSLHAKLAQGTSRIWDQSEELANAYVEKVPYNDHSSPPDTTTFLRLFQELRTRYHRRALLAERWSQGTVAWPA